MQSRRGSLLVVALWLVAILALLSVAISHRFSLELQLVRNRIAVAKARAIARGGIRVGMELLKMDQQAGAPPPHDWLGDAWALRPNAAGSEADPSVMTIELPAEDEPARAQIALRIVDEERKIPINRAHEQPFAGLALRLLLGSDELVNRVADYLDQEQPPQEREPGGERVDGEPPYEAKNGPVVRLEELREMPGMTDEAFIRLQEIASPFLDSTSRINVNTASLEVLDAVCASEGFPGLASLIVGFRWDPGDGDPRVGVRLTSVAGQITVLPETTPIDDALKQALTAAMSGPLRERLGVVSNRFTIESVVTMANPTAEYLTHAVVDRSQSPEKLLAWWEG